jgi:hypothetical protein
MAVSPGVEMLNMSDLGKFGRVLRLSVCREVGRGIANTFVMECMIVEEVVY